MSPHSSFSRPPSRRYLQHFNSTTVLPIWFAKPKPPACLPFSLPHPFSLWCLLPHALAPKPILPKLSTSHPSAPSQTLCCEAPALLDQVWCGWLVGLPKPGWTQRAFYRQWDRWITSAFTHKGWLLGPWSDTSGTQNEHREGAEETHWQVRED